MLVFHIAPENEEMEIALPTMLFDRTAPAQSCCFADFSVVKVDLIIFGMLVLVAYFMMPIAGLDLLATAALFTAESSTVNFVNVCTSDDFTKSAASG